MLTILGIEQKQRVRIASLWALSIQIIYYITPDEIHDNYVEINDDMLLSTDIYNALIQKAKH